VSCLGRRFIREIIRRRETGNAFRHTNIAGVLKCVLSPHATYISYVLMGENPFASTLPTVCPLWHSGIRGERPGAFPLLLRARNISLK
jgi:hypothetical protein